MPGIEERQFEAKGVEVSPFLPSKNPKDKSLTTTESVAQSRVKNVLEEEAHGPYGSLWGLQHLNWLHIHFTLGYEWTEFFSPGSELPQSGKIATYLQQRLGADWQWICDTNHHDSISIYAFFQRLIYQRKEDDDWRTATQASSDPNSLSHSKGQSLRNSNSPQQNRESTGISQEQEMTGTLRQAGSKSQPPTPGVISRKRSHESTPSPQRQPDHIFTSDEQREKTPPSRQHGERHPIPSPHTPKARSTPNSDDHGELSNIQDLREAAQGRQLCRLVEEEEEEEKAAQNRILQDEEEAEAGPDGLSEAASKDKSEKEVEVVGSGFLSVVLDAINFSGQGDNVDKKMLHAQNLYLHVGDADKTKIWIDGIPMTAKPDWSLFCQFGKVGHTKTVDVVIEFKKRNHMRPPSRILGQECAELLGLVSVEKESLERTAKSGQKAIKRDQTYTSHLISWHGLMAYVSRLDTTHEYLEQLNRRSNYLQEMKPPRVRRSRLLNLTKTQDRIDLALIAARLAVEQLSRYNRNTESGLIKRLRA